MFSTHFEPSASEDCAETVPAPLGQEGGPAPEAGVFDSRMHLVETGLQTWLEQEGFDKEQIEFLLSRNIIRYHRGYTREDLKADWCDFLMNGCRTLDPLTVGFVLSENQRMQDEAALTKQREVKEEVLRLTGGSDDPSDDYELRLNRRATRVKRRRGDHETWEVYQGKREALRERLDRKAQDRRKAHHEDRVFAECAEDLHAPDRKPKPKMVDERAKKHILTRERDLDEFEEFIILSIHAHSLDPDSLKSYNSHWKYLFTDRFQTMFKHFVQALGYRTGLYKYYSCPPAARMLVTVDNVLHELSSVSSKQQEDVLSTWYQWGRDDYRGHGRLVDAAFHLFSLKNFGGGYDQPALHAAELALFLDELNGTDERERLSALRILLVLAGVEQNPGPKQSKPQRPETSQVPPKPKRKAPVLTFLTPQEVERQRKQQFQGYVRQTLDAHFQQLQKQGPRHASLTSQLPAPHATYKNRGGATKINMGASGVKKAMEALRDEEEKLQDTLKAREERIRELREEADHYRQERDRMQSDAMEQIASMSRFVRAAQDAGYVAPEENSIVQEFSFPGVWTNDCNPVFSSDNVVVVRVAKNKRWYLENCGSYLWVDMPDVALRVAAFCAPCDSADKRFRNIYGALVSSSDMRAWYETTECHAVFQSEMNLRAFLLTGASRCTGKLKWLSLCEEFIPPKYVCARPDDWEDRVRGYIFERELLKLEARCETSCRCAPIRVAGLVAHMPRFCDFSTMIAGICKRLEPKLPQRKGYMKAAILEKVAQMKQMITDFVANDPDVEGVRWRQDPYDLAVAAIKDRPQKEKDGIMEGIKMCRDNFDQALTKYLSAHYKSFVKLEVYVPGTFKPPRFIMSLDLKYRGIQLYMMSRTLLLIERVTEEGNVKHRRMDEITKLLKKKFDRLDRVAETDFSSFESCISPWMRRHVENDIFKHCAMIVNDAHAGDEIRFIEQALDRKTVYVDGPGWRNPHFHHIRMSGDYWTSIGNLLTNIVLIAACTEWSVKDVIKLGLFEGDDGVFPAPKTAEGVERLKRRASDAGVLLTFDVAPWHALSFCGNHMELVNGELIRHRDPLKTLMNLCVIFNPNKSTREYDLMLQRSKCLSVLDGPWIPGASAFAAVVEFCTRNLKVDAEYLSEMGYRKEYSAYGLEECIPSSLRNCKTIDQISLEISDRERRAGGHASQDLIKKVIEEIFSADSDVATTPMMDITLGLGENYARDGLCWTHTYPEAQNVLKRARSRRRTHIHDEKYAGGFLTKTCWNYRYDTDFWNLQRAPTCQEMNHLVFGNTLYDMTTLSVAYDYRPMSLIRRVISWCRSHWSLILISLVTLCLIYHIGRTEAVGRLVDELVYRTFEVSPVVEPPSVSVIKLFAPHNYSGPHAEYIPKAAAAH